jgi:rod shape-determining protein MreC
LDRSPPPFFNQGPSAHARLIFFSLLAIGLLIVDSRLSSLAALRQGLGTALYPLQRTLLLPRDGLSLGSEYLSEVNRLRNENSELRRVEAANAKALLQAEQMASENARLRELLGARERSAVRSVIAEVLYDARDPFTRKLVLDKGLQNGVLAGQPVIDAKGLIGQVTRSFEFSSEVTLVTDRNATIPVEVQRNGVRSVAFGAGPGLMELRYLGPTTEIKPNDILVTSGLDNVYPAGLPVGKVKSMTRGSDQGFSRVMVEPTAGVDQTKALLVLMIDKSALPAAPPPEQALESRKRK